MVIANLILLKEEKNVANQEVYLVVLYCGGGFRSALAAHNIQFMGYSNVFSMSGGIRAWREVDYPQES